MNNHLIYKMKLYKVRQHTLAKMLGMTRQTLSRKLRTGKLTQVEIQTIEDYFDSLPEPTPNKRGI